MNDLFVRENALFNEFIKCILIEKLLSVKHCSKNFGLRQEQDLFLLKFYWQTDTSIKWMIYLRYVIISMKEKYKDLWKQTWERGKTSLDYQRKFP